MSEKPLIYERIAAAMEDVKAIDKNQRNEQQKFMFRGIDDVLNSMQPILAKHGIFVTQEITNRIRKDCETVTTYQGKENIKKFVHCINSYSFKFITVDGSFVETFFDGEGIDYGDKASNKCNSIALKYALINTFLIPTKELDDPDAESYEINQPVHRQAPPQIHQPQQKSPPPQKLGPDEMLRSERMIAAFKNDFDIDRQTIETFLGSKISACTEQDYLRLRDAFGRLRAGEPVNVVLRPLHDDPF